MLFLLGYDQKVCKDVFIYYSLMTLLLGTWGTHTDCVCATDHLQKMKNLTLLLLTIALKIHFSLSSLVQHPH